MIPADLAALRDLANAVSELGEVPRASWVSVNQAALTQTPEEMRLMLCLPAAQKALEQVERAARESDLAKRLVNRLPLCHDHRDKFAPDQCQACRAEQAEARAVRLEEQLASEWIRSGHASSIADAKSILRAALEGHDDAEWQRVHGAAQQAARDVAYWRRRAENAEARAIKEGRDE